MRRSSRSGNVAIIVAVSMLALLGFAALSIDIGYARAVKIELQNASEAAARGASLQLNGTSAGVTAARNMAVTIAARNNVRGHGFVLNANTSNSATGDVVMGVWNTSTSTFTPSTNAAAINTVQVRAQIASLGLFFAPVALGQASMPVAAETQVYVVSGGASATNCFIPLALADCVVERYTSLSQLENVTLKLQPAGVDNVGWGRPSGGNFNASWGRDQLLNCQADGEAAVGEPIALQNGSDTTVVQALATMITNSTTRWNTTHWGTIPARMSNSAITASNYGHTYEGPIMVFDGGSNYCTGGGGSYNETLPLKGWIWGAIYDVRTTTSAKDLRMRLEVMDGHEVGTAGGGPNYGITALSSPQMVAGH